MKTLIYRLFTFFCAMTSIVVTMSPITLAQNDCNAYWKKCHVEGVETIHTKDPSTSAGLLDTVKNAINRCLGILATVTLCFCMYWWFKMLTSWADSKWYDGGWKVLKNALIWLAIIWLAWMIVSVVFWFVSTLSGWNQTQSTGIGGIW